MLRLILLLAALAAPLSAKVESLALFVGVDEGLPRDRMLKYASRDATRLATLIREMGTFEKDRIYLLANPTLDKVKSTLEEIRGRIKELRKAGTQTSVLLYYSGHGSAQGLHVRGRIFAREDVGALLESLDSDLKIVILDACESGDFLRQKGGTVIEDREIVAQDRLKSHGTIVLSSSSRGEQAQESEDYKGAVFSHHLINGLRGLADYDSDGEVSLLEAFDYARASTRMEEIHGSAERQNPSFDFDVVGESDPVLSRLARSRSRIVFRRMPVTAVEIYNAQSQELEHRVWLTSRDSSVYQVPSGKFVLRYADRDGFLVKSVDLSWTPEASVVPEDFRRQGRTLLNRKGGFGDGLFVQGVQLGMRSAGPLLDLPLFGGDYVFRTASFKHSLGLAFGRQAGIPLWEGIRMDTDVYRLGYGARKSLFSSTYVQAQAGVDLAYHRVIQSIRDRRVAEGAAASGSAAPARQTAMSNVLEVGLPLEVEVYFPMRLWLGVSASGTAYRFRERESGRSGYHWSVEPGLNLGRQF